MKVLCFLFPYKILYISNHFKTLGYGVFATRDFGPGEFLLEYSGQLISESEGEKRQQEYHLEDGSFLFFYNKKW